VRIRKKHVEGQPSYRASMDLSVGALRASSGPMATAISLPSISRLLSPPARIRGYTAQSLSDVRRVQPSRAFMMLRHPTGPRGLSLPASGPGPCL
jgi:hypothetical protein